MTPLKKNTHQSNAPLSLCVIKMTETSWWLFIPSLTREQGKESWDFGRKTKHCSWEDAAASLSELGGFTENTKQGLCAPKHVLFTFFNYTDQIKGISSLYIPCLISDIPADLLIEMCNLSFFIHQWEYQEITNKKIIIQAIHTYKNSV